ncbi:hypothetical protein [Eikenella sp. NML01-A-086]|uniref:hypothetical protein n=1 Tax=Eikenella sp. NML01-A-086 TaxID=1795826 RepID=UPI0007E17A88|nr:hypothetical protein [Eikenella sp. NML01-A-086]OAM26262.1 hypothetical protein A7P94_08135 [Eikenella sp. NML01-A-086]
MNSDERYHAPQSEGLGSGTGQEAPELWNPNAAACWSLLFSPVFGAALHMLNARAMGDKELEKLNKGFLWGMVVVILVAIPVILIFDIANNVLSIALLGAWYGAVGRKQVTLVKDKFDTNYPRRSWGKPILFGILGVGGLFLYASVVVFILILMGAPSS